MDSTITTNTAKEVRSGRFPWGEDETNIETPTSSSAFDKPILLLLEENTAIINKTLDMIGELYSLINDPQCGPLPCSSTDKDSLRTELIWQNETLKTILETADVIIGVFGRR